MQPGRADAAQRFPLMLGIGNVAGNVAAVTRKGRCATWRGGSCHVDALGAPQVHVDRAGVELKDSIAIG